jgi:hypothetical protein
MEDFTFTNLWTSSLQEREHDKYESHRGRLRSAYLRFREHPAIVAAEIPQDLRDFTVHDITHLDALWEMADLICGADSQINPVEAFVLGGSFLIHDLGLSIAAFPEGRDYLMRTPVWQDHIIARLQSRLNRIPTDGEIKSAPEADKKAATETTLRILHAEQAEKLALTSFPHGTTTHYLIEDEELRNSLGPIIGQIAHSHWWPVPRLAREFGTKIGAPYWCPQEWTIDSLKLACMLRLADATHLDARRAPAFLRAIRKPEDSSDRHWAFQQNLQKPQNEADRIVFTSAKPFLLSEAPAWWLCYQTLQMVDSEFKQVDALLADTRKPRFALRAVAGCEDPTRLAKYIRTDGWVPVEAKIRISNVPDIVRKLGGEELYGEKPYVCLRELVQNAADAVEARRFLEGRESNWGSITVRLYKQRDKHILEVTDTGIGMSEQVLAGPFLDFGTSYWGSPMMSSEFPGLLARGFQSTGRFGIGFFSVFMVASKVSVLTRRFDQALADTRVLEFGKALSDPPILRPANQDERLRDGGTCIRLELSVAPNAQKGLLYYEHYYQAITLPSLLRWLCPALNVDLYAECDGNKDQVLRANDWLEISAKDLVARTVLPEAKMSRFEEGLQRIANRLTPITNEQGQIIGRIGMEAGEMWNGSMYDWDYDGVVTVGGLRASTLSGIAGILVGYPLRASRESAMPFAGSTQMARWATAQAEALATENLDPRTQADAARTLVTCDGNVLRLAIAYSAVGWLTPTKLRDFLRKKRKVRIINGDFPFRAWDTEISLDEDVLVISNRNETILYGAEPSRGKVLKFFEEWPTISRSFAERIRGPMYWSYEVGYPRACLLEAACEAWNVDLRDVVAGLKVAAFRQKSERVGEFRGKSYEEPVDTLVRPVAVRRKISKKRSRSKHP